MPLLLSTTSYVSGCAYKQGGGKRLLSSNVAVIVPTEDSILDRRRPAEIDDQHVHHHQHRHRHRRHHRSVWKSMVPWSLQKLAATSNIHDEAQLSTLLEDIALRLDLQHSLCVQLSTLVEDMKRANNNNNNNNNDNNNLHQKSIISTSSLLKPYWWKPRSHDKVSQRQKEQEQMELELELATKHLENLKTLHRDTFRLAKDACRLVLDNEQQLNTITQRPSASTNLYNVVATMKQIHARHATTIETMAELVIGLRPWTTTTTMTSQQPQPPTDFGAI